MALNDFQKEKLLSRGYTEQQVEDLDVGKTVSDVQPISVTSEGLIPQPQIQYQNPNESYFPPASSIQVPNFSSAELQPTKEEKGISDLLKQITEGQADTAGKSAFQSQQEQTSGLQTLRDTQTDIANRILALQAEERNIPLQTEKEFTGRASIGEIQNKSRAALRENAIQANILSSQLLASQNKIAAAQEAVNRAITAKFGPKEEELAAKRANLELLLKDPALTVGQQNRANAQKLVIQRQEGELSRQKENESAAQALIANVYKNFSTDENAKLAAQRVSQLDSKNPNYLQNVYNLVGQYQRDPIAVQKAILESQKISADIALTYANIAKVKNLSQTLSIADAQKLGVPYGTTKEQAIALGKVPGVQNEAGVLKQSASESAQGLLIKFLEGKGVSAVGKSAFLSSLGYGLVPGTERADFKVQFNNLKSLLSLDNVKYLKGQGQVSDAERRLLSEASSKLDLSQSESEFKNALVNIVKALSGIPVGEILVRDKKTGTIGSINPNEFNSTLYEKL